MNPSSLVSALRVGAATSLMLIGCGLPPEEGEILAPTENTENLIAGPTVTAFTANGGSSFVFSGQTLTLAITMSAPCPTGGCSLRMTSQLQSAIPLATPYVIPAGASSASLTVLVKAVPYATSASLSAGGKYIDINIFPALGAPAADGSYTMFAYGSSYRTGTGSVTKSLNREMAIRNMESHLARLVPKQCAAAIPGGIVTRVGSPVIVGEYKTTVPVPGLLQFDVTQKVKCSK